ncbi:hypothetical protein [Mesorhizobium sp.]|uniref:hypothetical protein n=1 Tax=Mesorhizobium sp. TaxID=1871066 RepID=UPI00257D27F5|nr:hypothetical protein [Mesorhizobium sp.]
MAQKQGATIRSNRSAVEAGDHFVAVEAFKFELIAATVCLHPTRSIKPDNSLLQKQLPESRSRCTPYFEMFRLSAVSWLHFNR